MSQIDQNFDEDFKIAENWAIFGAVGNVILTAFKAFAGIAGGSSAMIADAIHSASDIISSAVVFVSLKVAKMPPDDQHPYGHGKAEALSTLIVGLMLLAAGLEIIWSAFSTIKNGEIGTPGTIALIAAIVSILVKESMFRFTYAAGVRTNSPSTIANAYHHRSDAFSSVATLVGVGGAILGFPILDPLAGGIVALFILKMGYDILFSAIHQVMDGSPDQEQECIIKEAILNTPGVESAHSIRVRQSGPFYLVDLAICVDRKLNVDHAHEISEIVQENVLKSMNKIIEVRIHIDPYEDEDGAI